MSGKRALTPTAHTSARGVLEISWGSGPLFASHRFHVHEPINTMTQANTAAHCLPLRSRGFHVPPIRPVASQTPTILGRKPTRKPHHHGKPFSCRVSAGPCQQQGKCFSTAIGGERRFPFVFPTRHKSVSPIPYTLRHRTLRGETIHPSPIPPYQSAPVSA